MRYIGNKQKLLGEIDQFITEINPKIEHNKFCDLFSGTGVVSGYFKDRFEVAANDNLYSSYVLTHARLKTPSLLFKGLNFEPFEYLNNNLKVKEGFIYNNYAPLRSGRSYFSDTNALVIDSMRMKIEDWFVSKKINSDEYYFLLASLLESVSKVANVAGVYGSYLKSWDPRALKGVVIRPLEANKSTGFKHSVFNEDVFDLLKKIQGDILYIDPPYTKNQYSVQYHILETISLYDNPEIFGKTGKRDTSKNTSVFSQVTQVLGSFDKLICLSKFKHLFLSYSSAGLLSKDQIRLTLLKYGKSKSYIFKEIKYKQYLNSKTKLSNSHSEYLFYIEKDL